MKSPKKHRIVIIGGGFAGVEVARRLQARLPIDWETILYSRENHFVFTPMLAEVVGSALTPIHVVCPIRLMVRYVSSRTAQVVGFDPKTQEVIFKRPDGQLGRDPYDHLVLAAGLAVNVNIVPGMGTYGWQIKTLGDALVLRNRVVGQLERAQVTVSPELKARLLSFAVVGGGITGIEVAGSIADLLKEGCRYYDRINPEEIRVTVVHGPPRILDQFPESLSSFALRKIRKGGVDIRTGVRVEAVTVEGIRLKGGEFVKAGTVISAVGNTIQPLFADAGLPVVRNRIKVTPEMRVEGYDNVWALGDCAAVLNALDGSISPTLGQFAIRQARQVAENLRAVIGGRPPKPFRYRMQGMFATIGRNNAVGLSYGVHFSGFLASLAWHAIYWARMPTMTRKVKVALDWFLDRFSPPNIVGFSTLPTESKVHIDDGRRLEPLIDKYPELRQLRVADVMDRSVPTLKRHVSIAEAIRLVREEGTLAFPVVDDDGRMQGICTRSDLYSAIGSLRSPDTVVEEIMKSPVITAREDTSIDEVIQLARTNEVRRLVVVSDASPDRPIGMLTYIDIVHWFTAHHRDQPAASSQGRTHQ